MITINTRVLDYWSVLLIINLKFFRYNFRKKYQNILIRTYNMCVCVCVWERGILYNHNYYGALRKMPKISNKFFNRIIQ